MIKPIRSTQGQPRMNCICDKCGRAEVVAVRPGQGANDGGGQARKKIQNHGWTFLRKVLRCPSCEAKRKVENVKSISVKKACAKAAARPAPPPEPPRTPLSEPPPNPLRQPSRAQRRDIMDLLGEVYDTDQERYCRGDTDHTLADVLSVMPGWVSQIREEFFGPDGGNEDIEALFSDLLEWMPGAAKALIVYTEVGEILRGQIVEATDHLARLEKIKAAVGPRAMARAK